MWLVGGRQISRSALRAPLRPSAERKRPADAAFYGTAEAVPLSKTDLQTGQGVGGWGGVERREEWMGGRQPQPASWPGTPVRAGQRAKSARRGPRFAHPTDEDLSAGTPVLHPTDEDLSAGTPVRAFARCSHLRIESWGTRRKSTWYIAGHVPRGLVAAPGLRPSLKWHGYVCRS